MAAANPEGECADQAMCVLRGHTQAVESCVVSPDGRTLYSSSEDETVIVWNLRDGGTPVKVLNPTHNHWVWAIALSPDGCTLATSSNRIIRLWNMTGRGTDEYGTITHVLQGHTRCVMTCAFSPDGATLATVSGDKTVRLWDTASGECVCVMRGHNNWVMACVFSPDGATLATASDDRTVFLWNATRECHPRQRALHMLAGHSDRVRACAFAPNGALLASASYDWTLRLWDVAHGGPSRQILNGHTEGVMACGFSPDGALLVSASIDSTLRVWDVSSVGHATPRCVLRGHKNTVYAFAFSPSDCTRLASTSRDRTVRLWDTESGAEERVLRGHTHAVTRCAFTPDGAMLASASMDFTLRLWDMRPELWCPATHRDFTQSFRNATTALLALAHAPRCPTSGHMLKPCYPSVPLARLPHELLLYLCNIAAH